MPFVEERVAETRALMGDDYWPYGVEPTARRSRRSCATITRRGCRRGCVKVEELFHPGTLESFKI